MMPSVAWQIIYSKTVLKIDISALDNAVKKRVKTAIESKLMRDPLTFGKPLRYSLSNQRSLRVGDYRVLYLVEHDSHTIFITAIGHRRDIYEE
ncbi:MAG: type II toxin-antitoxin system RelE/ParE family toxin [Rickettsiales bacterium]|jgi:mRNA interferase RelE/StbE